jgi:DNA-binding PadR family transcriptional regulator
VSIDYSILGVLMEQPSHGYSIKKTLGESISKDLGINDGQLYPALARLESRGWIAKRVVPQRRNPAKHLYRVTEEGERAFYGWLRDPEPDPQPARYDYFWKHDFLQRCTFFRYLEPEEIRSQVRQKIAEIERRISDLEGVAARLRARQDDPYRRMIVEYGIRYQRMRLEWLDDLLARTADRGADEPPPLVARAR